MSIETLSAQELYEKGKQLQTEKKPKEAIKYLVAAQKKDPELKYVYTSLANAYLQAKDPERAIKAYRQSIKLHKHDAAYHNLGNLYFYLKMYGMAAYYLKQAEKKGYGDANTYLLLGKSLFYSKRFDESLKIVTKGYEKTSNEQLKDIREKLKEQKKRLAEKFPGVKVLMRRMQKNPGVLKNYNELAIHYGKINDHKSAEQVLKKALSNNQDKIAAYQNLAAYYINWNRLKEAASILEKGLKLKEKSNTYYNLYLNLAQTYLKLGEKKNAKKVLKDLLKEEPPKKEMVKKLLESIKDGPGKAA